MIEKVELEEMEELYFLDEEEEEIKVESFYYKYM